MIDCNLDNSASMMGSLNPSQPLRVFSPAKINWVLTIHGRRPDGFHDIDTVFQALDYGDDLVCRPLDEAECRIDCDRPGIPTDETNLIHQAWRLLRSEFPAVGGLAVQLHKRLPAGAGLGGGSSNAAAALVAINDLYRLQLGEDRLENYAARLGSDCAFFIRGGTARAEGRGELLTPVESRLNDCWLVVVWPGFASSTVEAYRRVRPTHYEGAERVEAMVRALNSGNPQRVRRHRFNRFSCLVSEADPRYKGLSESMKKSGVGDPILCGSGSAMFGFAENQATAQDAAARLGTQWPVAFAARPVDSGIEFLRRELR